MKGTYAYLITLLVACSMASPTFPYLEGNKGDPVDTCLMLCYKCFSGNDKMMMMCANDICMSGSANMEMGFLWIGKHCEKVDSMEKFLFADKKA